MENEVWKRIPNYTDYEVSNLGRVRSFKQRPVKVLRPTLDTAGYLTVYLYGVNKKRISIHSLVAISFLNHERNGYNGLVVDHINRDKLDNRLVNLRLATRRENLSNTSRVMASNYIGVTFCKRLNKWKARVTLNKKRIHLGVFENEYEAHLSYQKALRDGN